jgi:hypothetical protein
MFWKGCAAVAMNGCNKNQYSKGLEGRRQERRLEAKRAGRRIRTDDLLITNQLLYQLSYAGFGKRR